MHIYEQMVHAFMSIAWVIAAVIVFVVIAEGISQIDDSIVYFSMSHIRN